jgi:hypothetical protein
MTDLTEAIVTAANDDELRTTDWHWRWSLFDRDP